MRAGLQNPPRNGEGDHAKHGGGGPLLYSLNLGTPPPRRFASRSPSPFRGGFLFALALLATPGLTRDLSVGTGWSRAPDLSVYAALVLSGELAQEREMLCRGRNPARVEDEWRAAYGARQAWIADALTRRYGAPAVSLAADVKVGRLTCPTIADQSWRRHHERMLRLLELRLVPRDHFRRPAP